MVAERYTQWKIAEVKVQAQLEPIFEMLSQRPEYQIDLVTGQVFIEFWGMKVVEISKGVWCRVR